MLRDWFRCLIECGDSWTKSELLSRLSQIASYNTDEFEVISKEEYTYIEEMIKSSSLPD